MTMNAENMEGDYGEAVTRMEAARGRLVDTFFAATREQ
jgi:hypothetical protein